MDLSKASEQELQTAWLKKRREHNSSMLTRASGTEIRHVARYAAQDLQQLRIDVLNPKLPVNLAIFELLNIIDDLQHLVSYLDGKGYATSSMGNRNERTHSEGYKRGLAQGRADAYYGNLPNCPECKAEVTQVSSKDHWPGCLYRERG